MKSFKKNNKISLTSNLCSALDTFTYNGVTKTYKQWAIDISAINGARISTNLARMIKYGYPLVHATLAKTHKLPHYGLMTQNTNHFEPQRPHPMFGK